MRLKYLADWNAMVWLIAAVLIFAGCRQERHFLIGVKNTSDHPITNAQIRSDQASVKFTYGKLGVGNEKLYWWPTGSVPQKLTFNWDSNRLHVESVVELTDKIRERIAGNGERLIFELGAKGVVGLYIEVINDLEPGNPFLHRAIPPIIKDDETAVFSEFGE